MVSNPHSTNWEDRLDRRKDIQNHRYSRIVIGDIGASEKVIKRDYSKIAIGVCS